MKADKFRTDFLDQQRFVRPFQARFRGFMINKPIALAVTGNLKKPASRFDRYRCGNSWQGIGSWQCFGMLG